METDHYDLIYFKWLVKATKKMHYNLSIRCMDITLTPRAHIHKPSQNFKCLQWKSEINMRDTHLQQRPAKM